MTFTATLSVMWLKPKRGDGRRWVKNSGIFRAAELCKDFTQGFNEYVLACHGYDEEFIKYAVKLTSRRNREGILSDARSIAPVSLSEFDRDKFLLNCHNGALNLKYFALQQHNAFDLITKMAHVKYDPEAHCERWERFIDEITTRTTCLIWWYVWYMWYVQCGSLSFFAMRRV